MSENIHHIFKVKMTSSQCLFYPTKDIQLTSKCLASQNKYITKQLISNPNLYQLILCQLINYTLSFASFSLLSTRLNVHQNSTFNAINASIIESFNTVPLLNGN